MQDTPYSLTRRDALKKSALLTGSLVVGGTALTGSAAAGIGDGRVAHYTLNNLHYNVDQGVKTQNHVHDASTFKNHGKWMGADDPVTKGAVGNAYEFAGGHIAIDDDASLHLEEVTIAAWVNPNGSKSKEYIFDGPGHQYGLKEHDGTEVPRFFLFDDQNTLYTLNADASLPSNTWTHVAASYDGDAMRIYLNGSLAGTTSTPSRPIGTSAGSSLIGDYRGGGYSFAGALDEVRVYNRALSGAEIGDLAAMGEE